MDCKRFNQILLQLFGFMENICWFLFYLVIKKFFWIALGRQWCSIFHSRLRFLDHYCRMAIPLNWYDLKLCQRRRINRSTDIFSISTVSANNNLLHAHKKWWPATPYPLGKFSISDVLKILISIICQTKILLHFILYHKIFSRGLHCKLLQAYDGVRCFWHVTIVLFHHFCKIFLRNF